MVVMAHGLNAAVLKRASSKTEAKTGIGSRRIFPAHFKLQVLDSYRNDADCKGNQRATARKYGIHRRQIQKWLQVEANLRSSVIGGKEKIAVEVECEARKCELALSCHRQRDAAGSTEARVPALSPAAYSENGWPDSPPQQPLNFTTHHRPDPAAPLDDLTAPMDLSLKRPSAPGDPSAPAYLPPHPTTPPLIQSPQTHSLQPQQVPSAPSSTSSTSSSNPDIWDLSTKSLKRKHEDPVHSTNPKPVKLFKPYLDDLHDSSNSSTTSSDDAKSIKSNSFCYAFDMGSPYYNNNNNNNNILPDYTYNVHELHAKTYYYHHPSSYPAYPPHEMDPAYLYDADPFNSTPLKQRQTYSLDFKLRAIECYYRDESCRGNQRAVATKYNIHRRQVQKWLKQEEELRQRNESHKLVHVR